MTSERRTIRCAVYTRKSSEEGLEQAFNSLDAQFEACVAYIASQKHEGWKLAPARYDDGGFSGGTLERPGLNRLLADIECGRIDLVVVYKIDRLTRSLMDFSRLVERFDKFSCSFVSVTQAFNTSTSMGRLTLNVLLSFAQFEREVTAERIRDKIAASKKKGIWMGGVPPLGYAAKERELIVDEREAMIVRKLFDLYLQQGCVARTTEAADRLGLRSRPKLRLDGLSAEGARLSRGRIHGLLTNPVYVGEIRHKDLRYPGLHAPIVDRDIWDRVQATLSKQSVRGRGRLPTSVPSPLAGKLIDESGDRLTPTYASKAGRRFRYYVSRRLIDRSSSLPKENGWRLAAEGLEASIAAIVRDQFSASDLPAELHIEGSVETFAATQRRLAERFAANDRFELLALVKAVTVDAGSLHIELGRATVASWLGIDAAAIPSGLLSISAPFQKRRRGVETRLVFGEDQPKADPVLLRYIARGFAWWDEIMAGASLVAIAKRENVTSRLVARHLDAAFLAPDIVKAIVEGRHPRSLTAMTLRDAKLSLLWSEQKRLLESDGNRGKF